MRVPNGNVQACGCNNRFFASKQKLQLEKFLTPNGERGYGLRAKQHIVEDAYIGEYIGTLLCSSTFSDECCAAPRT